MTLGTGQAKTEKYLGGVIDELFRVLQFLVPNSRWAGKFIAGSCQDFASEFVVGFVGCNRIANPLMECERA